MKDDIFTKKYIWLFLLFPMGISINASLLALPKYQSFLEPKQVSINVLKHIESTQVNASTRRIKLPRFRHLALFSLSSIALIFPPAFSMAATIPGDKVENVRGEADKIAFLEQLRTKGICFVKYSEKSYTKIEFRIQKSTNVPNKIEITSFEIDGRHLSRNDIKKAQYSVVKNSSLRILSVFDSASKVEINIFLNLNTFHRFAPSPLIDSKNMRQAFDYLISLLQGKKNFSTTQNSSNAETIITIPKTSNARGTKQAFQTVCIADGYY